MAVRHGGMLASSVALAALPLALAAPGSASTPTTAPAPKYHPLISLHTPTTAHGMVQSTNWSGYDKGALDTGSTFQSISGHWTVPTVSQHTPGQAESSATWIGIGGGCVNMTQGCSVTDPTLIQAGTEQDVNAQGKPSYSAWWEILPAPSISTSMPVHPGDHMSATIKGPGVWTITVKDLTDGQSFTQTVPYASTMDSAEWIQEAPTEIGSGGVAQATLPNSTTPSFDLTSV
ncbi:MAG TPA: G1 family glutamic endopeptidase, partial [Acidimicrobiales bacterium]|nr:G1 family glutamic endopeptidase [Acidimicrobiales bacterium]